MVRRFCFVVSLLLPVSLLAQNAAVSVSVDASADRKPISPLIYGLSYASAAALSDLNVPLNRSGGNATTRYNWQSNASNRAADWYFESLSEGSPAAGAAGDEFIGDAKSANAEAMLTIPMIGWVAKLGPNGERRSSFSIAKYGAQQDRDWQWFPDAGNGVRTDGTRITTNDPNDANMLADENFQAGWVQHLVSRWGTASSGGLRYYILDNEASIWQETHRDVHPVGPTMDEVRDKTIRHAAKIKSIDPGALVVAGEEWGWGGYLYSGYDQQYGAAHGWCCFPDRDAHGGADYMPWLLGQIRQHDAAAGQRLIDVFTVHYYPQGGEFSNDTSSSMQLRRNRSTRSLWDPSYVDETWINDRVQLLPRLHSWVDTQYPGTKLGITEYNWGAEGHINGATTQADILGIFGREGLDLATRWTTPDASTPTYKAIRMYRNYDGSKSTFGDVSVRASGANPDTLSSFAAVRSADGALTVMLVSKVLSGTTPVTVTLANFSPTAAAQRWQLTSSNSIQRLTDVVPSSNAITLTVPPQSITLLVVPGGGSPPPLAAAASVRGGETVCLGGSSTIYADLTGTSPWTLLWNDGVTQIVDASPATRVVSPTATTSYTLTSFGDASGAGTTAGSAVVTVRTSATITSQPQSRTIKRRSMTTLSVTAAGSTPLSYQWYRGVSGDTSMPVGTNSSTYKTPRLSTATSYWVRVSNDCGAVDSTTATITIR